MFNSKPLTCLWSVWNNCYYILLWFRKLLYIFSIANPPRSISLSLPYVPNCLQCAYHICRICAHAHEMGINVMWFIKFNSQNQCQQKLSQTISHHEPKYTHSVSWACLALLVYRIISKVALMRSCTQRIYFSWMRSTYTFSIESQTHIVRACV